MSAAESVRPQLCGACSTDSMFGPLHLYPETGMGKGDVLVATMASTRAFGKVRSVPLTAWSCRQCGHVELRAADPEALFQLWSAEQN